MAKALDLINRAYTLVGYKDPAETLSGQDTDHALSVLNDMIDSWNTDSLFIYTISEVVATVSGLPIPIGPSLAINATRPMKMENGSYAKISGISYPIQWVDNVQYQSIPLKNTVSTIPIYGFYDGGYPTGNIYLWPYQTTATELHLQVQSQLTSFPDLTTDVKIPQGYRKAIIYSLAEELAAGLRELPAAVVVAARSARRSIRNANVNVPLLGLSKAGTSPIARFLAGQ